MNNPAESSLREKGIFFFGGAHSSRLQSFMMGKSQWQKFVITGLHYIHSQETERKVQAHMRLTFSFSYSQGPWPREWARPPKLTIQDSPHEHVQRLI